MFKNISIRVKLIVLLLFSLLGIASSLSYLAINASKKAMLEDELNKLTAIESTKRGEIQKYFSTLDSLLSTLSYSVTTQEAFSAFHDGFYKLDKETHIKSQKIYDSLNVEYKSNYINLVNYNVPTSAQKRPLSEYIPKDKNAQIAQYIFISHNRASLGHKNVLNYDSDFQTTYMKAHKKYHSTFNKYLDEFHLYDIFFIDLTGRVIYTDFKEKDFATNLKNGVYANTGLARVYKKALKLKQGKIAFEDFKPYEPSYNAYASFVATPLFKNKKLVGVLAIQTPVSEINNIVNFDGLHEQRGLGKSGECYLVGADFTMRSNSRFLKDIDNKVIQDLKSTIGIFKISTQATQKALSGKSGSEIITSYNGKKTLSAYSSIDIFHTTKWAIVAEVSQEEALEVVKSLTTKLVYMSILIALVFSMLTLYFSNILISKPLEEFKEGLLHFFNFLQGNEKEIKHLHVLNNDEIGKMAVSVNNGILVTKEHFIYKANEQWIRDGVGKLNAILAEVATLKENAQEAIEFLCSYSNSNTGVVYLYDKQTQTLVPQASFAYDGELKSFPVGEGVIGQVAKDRKPMNLVQMQTQPLKIKSATQAYETKDSYIFVLEYTHELVGVVEVASLREFSQKDLDFFKASARSITTALSSAIQNTQLQQLLEETELANTNLALNQTRLEEANASMEEQQQQLEMANVHMEEQQQQLEEANANMEEQQQQLQISEQNLKLQNESLEETKKELEEQAKALKEADKYKSEFLANMSHELRTPLNAIILLSQLLEKNKKNNLLADDLKKAKTIFNSGHELLRLINDILDLSKVESGKMEIVVDKFHSNTFLENIQNLFEDSVREKGLDFEVIDEYNGIIFSDSNRISQIVRNLISNALKFTSEGTIKVKFERTADERLPLKISVSDSGIGIPKEKQEQIFLAFTQADGSTSRKYGGTGLGLSISRELASLLGGDISLSSVENEGSTFSVRLASLENEEKFVDEKTISNAEKPLEIKEEKVILKIDDDRENLENSQAILVIENNNDLANKLLSILKEEGEKVLLAQNAKDALSLLDEYKVEKILLNLTLPDMEGIELLKEIKSNPYRNKIATYIISSSKEEQTLILEIKEFLKDEEENVEDMQEIDLSDLHILVVDDDIKNIFVLDSALSESGAKVSVAYNGKEALERLAEDSTIKIVLMDIMMPVMDGYEAIQKIREDESLSSLPIITVTAKSMKDDRNTSLAKGADDFITKPINIEALTRLVRVWSDKRHQ